MAPAFHPDGEFGAVPVEAGEDDDAGGGVRGGGRGGEHVVDGDVLAFVGEAVGVGNVDFLDGMGSETVVVSMYTFCLNVPGEKST